jgi:hypothetical protein
MHRATLVLGIAALAITAFTSFQATARDGCGEGWYFNGRGCAPMGQRFYGEPPMYAPERHYYGGWQGGPPRPTVGRNGVVSCNNPNYTWQDGACRPYRGPR